MKRRPKRGTVAYVLWRISLGRAVQLGSAEGRSVSAESRDAALEALRLRRASQESQP